METRQEPPASPTTYGPMFARQLPRLVQFVRGRAGGVVIARETPTDIAQSVCREAIQDLSEFEYRGEEQFGHWLCKRALRKIYHRHRWHRQHKRDAAREEYASTFAGSQRATMTTPSRQAAGREELARFERALEALPAAQRDAIALTRVEGLSYAEAAARLDRSESAIRGLVMRGLARVATELDGRIPEAS